MRKNKMMRFASALLVLTLLTTCTISGTFAKYVTSAGGTDTARVAKWGVGVVTTGETFADTYEFADGVTTTITSDYSVDSADGKDVVAPGTSGSMAAIALAGIPEVAVEVKYEVTTLTLENWKLDADTEYCPIIFTVNDVTYGTTDTTATNQSTTVADLITAVKEAIEECSAEYAPNTNLTGLDDKATPNVSWEWPYEVGADAEAIAAQDAKDTVLGDAATPATITLTIKTTVTQID